MANTSIYAAFERMWQHIVLLVGNKIEQAQSDWNQNDETAPDYVKNRPFYEENVCEQITIYLNGFYSNEAIDTLIANSMIAKYVIDGKECIYVKTAYEDDRCYHIYVSDGGRVYNIQFLPHASKGTTPLVLGDDGAPNGTQGTIEFSVTTQTNLKKIDEKYLPEHLTKPLLLDANLSDYYGGNVEAGDEALEAIKSGRQILVKVPNADGGNYTAIYSPIYMYQVPNYSNQYLYLFYLKDEKQDLSALLGQPAGTVLMPIYGELMMLLSEKYYNNPLES